MPSFYKFAAAALAVAQASAQTYTSCNPLEKTCPADKGTTESNLSFDFTKSLDQWTTTAGTVKPGSDGAAFTINQKGDAPTIETDFYIFFGDVSVTMKAAPGTGIVSSIVFESDDLDEIDWVRIPPHSSHPIFHFQFQLFPLSGCIRLLLDIVFFFGVLFFFVFVDASHFAFSLMHNLMLCPIGSVGWRLYHHRDQLLRQGRHHYLRP